MSRHFKIMLRHKAKLKGKKLCRDKEILCCDIFQEKQRMKRCCNKVLCRDKRHSYKTTLVEIYRDIFEVHRDKIQEESMKLCRNIKL